VYTHVSVGVFTRLFLSRLVDSTFLRMDGSLVDAWPYFPALKVGKLFLYSSFFDYLVALFYKS
jgi:hypothetical protein